MVAIVQCPTCGKFYHKGPGVRMSKMKPVPRWKTFKLLFWRWIYELADKKYRTIHTAITDEEMEERNRGISKTRENLKELMENK